jgi:hypothetical protein
MSASAEPSVMLLMRHDNRRSLVSSGKTTGCVPARQIGPGAQDKFTAQAVKLTLLSRRFAPQA